MKKWAIVTIDTEGHDGEDPINHLILGETTEGKYGIEYIMDQLDAYNVRALFFVDFAEAWDYGEDKIKQVVDTILQRGHDIGVHIHPDHMADKNRLFLWEYTKDEQFEIIKKCTDLYKKLVGREPKSFRAGKYGANYDTLDIVCELGYKYDFSSFYHQQWCGIRPEFTVNAPCRYKTLIEFPVTMHTTFKLGTIKREDKIDMEGMTTGEFKYAINQASRQEFPIVVTMFLHSFSLLNWREHPNNPVKNSRKVKKLCSAIDYVKNMDAFDIISEADLSKVELVSTDRALNSEIIWKCRAKGISYTFIKAVMIAKYNKKARYLVAAVGCFCFIFIVIIILLLRFL